jgi:hypothetical protein
MLNFFHGMSGHSQPQFAAISSIRLYFANMAWHMDVSGRLQAANDRAMLFLPGSGAAMRTGAGQRSKARKLVARLSLIFLLATSTMVLAADWPPTLDRKNTPAKTFNGRRIERYTHGARPEWDYPENSSWQYPAPQESGPQQQNHDSFYVVSPQKPRRNAPLCVVLHSANRTAFDYLGYQFLDRKVDPQDEPGAVMTRTPDDCYTLFLNSTNEEWWGWTAAHADPSKYGQSLTPAEKRVLDSIGWVIQRYHIDRNRVYLSGVSMGGCGALAVGLPHGNIFAAMLVVVPAGTEYGALRMGFPATLSAGSSPEDTAAWAKQISGAGLPDPPVLVNFSSQTDNWSKTQPELLRAAEAGHLPLILAWGPFGHTGSSTPIAKYPEDDVALAFPWLEIQKNAAYPVFTSATSDQRSPWGKLPNDFDESGQINAYFRWKSVEDKPKHFAMSLWLAHPSVKNPPPAMPESSTADVTLRRLQSFQVMPGKSYSWKLVCEGRVVASGKVSPDAANLLTIPQVPLSVTPAELFVEAAK